MCYSGQQETRILLFLSRGTGFIADPLLQIQSSRPIAQDRPRGVRDVGTGVISTGTVSSMITDSIVMINVECQPLPRGVDLMCLDSRWTDALIVLGGEF